MKLRPVLTVLLMLALLSPPLATEGQQAGKVSRIGMLHPGVAPSGPQLTPMKARGDAFLHSLSGLGYVEGQNLDLQRRYAAGNDDRLNEYAAELARMKVDAIFAVSSSALRAARTATTTIPIVALDLESDPVESGFIVSLARPAGNVTGVFLDLPEFNGKRLELLKETVRDISPTAVLWDSATDRRPVEALETAARSYGVSLQVLPVRTPQDFVGAFRAARTGGARALVVLQAPLTDRHGTEIAALASQSRLPAIAMFREFPDVGGLLSYGPNLNDLFGRVGVYIGKILNGAKPGELPAERPTRFDLVINLKTAKAFNLTIPPSLLVRADDIIH